jgi:transposase-like protein
MDKNLSPKRHRFPMHIISYAIWRYHRFNDSYRDIQEGLAYRGIRLAMKILGHGVLSLGGRLGISSKNVSENQLINSIWTR